MIPIPCPKMTPGTLLLKTWCTMAWTGSVPPSTWDCTKCSQNITPTSQYRTRLPISCQVWTAAIFKQSCTTSPTNGFTSHTELTTANTKRMPIRDPISGWTSQKSSASLPPKHDFSDNWCISLVVVFLKPLEFNLELINRLLHQMPVVIWIVLLLLDWILQRCGQSPLKKCKNPDCVILFLSV